MKLHLQQRPSFIESDPKIKTANDLYLINYINEPKEQMEKRQLPKKPLIFHAKDKLRPSFKVNQFEPRKIFDFERLEEIVTEREGEKVRVTGLPESEPKSEGGTILSFLDVGKNIAQITKNKIIFKEGVGAPIPKLQAILNPFEELIITDGSKKEKVKQILSVLPSEIILDVSKGELEPSEDTYINQVKQYPSKSAASNIASSLIKPPPEGVRAGLTSLLKMPNSPPKAGETFASVFGTYLPIITRKKAQAQGAAGRREVEGNIIDNVYYSLLRRGIKANFKPFIEYYVLNSVINKKLDDRAGSWRAAFGGLTPSRNQILNSILEKRGAGINIWAIKIDDDFKSAELLMNYLAPAAGAPGPGAAPAPRP